MISTPRAGMRLAPRVAVIAGLVALVGAAIAGPASAAATPTPAASSTSAADENWLVAAHQMNLAEIAAGRDAGRYASDSDVRSFADQLVDDHTTLDKRIVSLSQKYDVFLPGSPTAAQAQALAALQGKEGEAYDTAWVKARIVSHRQARVVNQGEVTNGEADDVKAAARDTGVTEERHLSSLGDLSQHLGISRPPAAVSGGTGGQAAAEFARSHQVPAGILAAVGVALIGAELVLGGRRRRAAR
jgi:putative membrane protein